MTRYIDSVNKERGLADDQPTGLRLDPEAAAIAASLRLA
jgi:hypothetical protein